MQGLGESLERKQELANGGRRPRHCVLASTDPRACTPRTPKRMHNTPTSSVARDFTAARARKAGVAPPTPPRLSPLHPPPQTPSRFIYFETFYFFLKRLCSYLESSPRATDDNSQQVLRERGKKASTCAEDPRPGTFPFPARALLFLRFAVRRLSVTLLPSPFLEHTHTHYHLCASLPHTFTHSHTHINTHPRSRAVT